MLKLQEDMYGTTQDQNRMQFRARPIRPHPLRNYLATPFKRRACGVE